MPDESPFRRLTSWTFAFVLGFGTACHVSGPAHGAEDTMPTQDRANGMNINGIGLEADVDAIDEMALAAAYKRIAGKDAELRPQDKSLLDI